MHNPATHNRRIAPPAAHRQLGIAHYALCIAMCVLSMVLLSACHSNEANYKAAYEKAMEKRVSDVGAEEMTRILAESTKPTMVVNGDSVRVVVVRANVTDDSAAVAHRYGIVVAQFKQKFNAITMRNRLRTDEGFPSYVLFGGPERKYFVIVKGFDELDVAAAFLKTAPQNVKMKILEPKPWILDRR